MVGPKTKEAKLKIVGGDLPGSNQQDLDPTIYYITSFTWATFQHMLRTRILCCYCCLGVCWDVFNCYNHLYLQVNSVFKLLSLSNVVIYKSQYYSIYLQRINT